MNTVTTDVLIVGAGPSGLAMAALLAREGIDAITVTKYGGTAHSPRAHITNQRTMEVFRDLGMAADITRVATPNDLTGNNVWATSFAGPEIARLLTWGSGPERRTDYDLASPCAMVNIPQHVMEPVQLRRALDLGADIRFGMEVVAISQDDEGVTAQVRARETGQEFRIHAKYVVGADGGRSLVADQLGFEMDGQMGLGAAVNVWLEADLTKYTAHRPGTLYWMSQPGNDFWVGSGTWICVKPWTEWVLLFMYNPEDGEPDLSEAALIHRAQTTIGDPAVDIRIKAVSQWSINHVVATRFGQGRAFLVGDAAHRHPPANGLGTNTSIQDSFNLAWKLAYVLRGQAGPALLESYHDERQPVGRQVVDRAMRSVQDMLPISQALGFTHGQSAEDGWASLDELFGTTELGEQRRKRLHAAVQLQNYQFNCHGVELDQRYASTAVIDDGTAWPAPTRDPELYHHPTTHPGARLPHAQLELDRQPVSTLDLVGKGRFTLLAGLRGQDWVEAARKVAADLGIPLDARIVGPQAEAADVLGRWAQLREITDAGALLVRPDHHIAWRSTGSSDAPGADLDTALRRILARADIPATRAGHDPRSAA